MSLAGGLGRPVGRAHFRLVWTADARPQRPVLWLETLNADFSLDGRADTRAWTLAALAHAALHAALDTSGTYRGTYEAKSTRPRRPKTPAAASSPSSSKS